MDPRQNSDDQAPQPEYQEDDQQYSQPQGQYHHQQQQYPPRNQQQYPQNQQYQQPVPQAQRPVPHHKPKQNNIPHEFDKAVISQKVQQLLIFVYTALSLILTARFILSLIGASQDTPFVSFVYQLTVPFVSPFANMFGRQLQAGQFRFEFEVLVALLVYALIFVGIAKLIAILFD